MYADSFFKVDYRAINELKTEWLKIFIQIKTLPLELLNICVVPRNIFLGIILLAKEI